MDSRHIPAIEQRTSFFRTCFNCLNTMAGVGILSIPFALSQGGWLSLLLLLLVALLCFYTALLLQRCMESNAEIKTYPDIGQAAFGRKGRVAISIFLYLELYLVAVGFLILAGDNLSKLFPHMSINMAGHRIRAKQCFILATALAVLPTTWMKSLGLLAYLSAGGVLASMILLASVCDHFGISYVRRVSEVSSDSESSGIQDERKDRNMDHSDQSSNKVCGDRLSDPRSHRQ